MPYKYKINEEFFLTETLEAAYVLGWIYSDGTLRKNRYQFKISSNDKESLELLRKLMNSSHNIYKYLRKNRKFPNYSLVIDSKSLYNQLLNWGLTPNKSKIIKMPSFKKYIQFFLRGYFEGDGSVWIENMQNKLKTKIYQRIRISFTSGSKIFLEELNNLLMSKLALRIYKVRVNHSAFSLDYASKDALKILNFLYTDNSDIAMSRKLNTFRNFVNI